MRARCCSRILALGIAAFLGAAGGALAGVVCDDPFAEHGAGATKACNNRCLGEAMSCTATFFNLDGFGDSLQLLEAFDTVDGSIRVPAAGNLPIIAVLGNAVCTGAACNPATGAGCTFPCLVCTAGSGASHGGLTCPALLQGGAVRVRQATHILTHTGDTPDTVSFNYTDNCDSGCANCPTTQLTTPAGSNTVVPDCSDTNPCNIDCCDLGICSHPSTCVGATCRGVDGVVTVFPPLDCDDGDSCTTDVCDDTSPQTGCCVNTGECICGDNEVNQDSERCDGTDAGTLGCSAAGSGAPDACRANCTCCGDSILDAGETCDTTVFEPGAPAGRTCRSNCTFCGDGTVDSGEQCDDGNDVDTDECRNDCTRPQGEAICRTPGFWGTHARAEGRSQNITQAVINAAGGSITVCGECINATVPINNAASAVEALCVAPKGASVLQNARQLTAMALNCIVSGFGADCGGDGSLDDLFDDCNAACLGLPSDRTNEECRAEIDCFNNGGIFHGGKGSFCQTGTCANGDPCNGSRACADGSACTPLPGNCHDRELCNEDVGLCFDPPGPAGSSQDCHAAIQNHCAVLDLTCSNTRGGGSGEDCCGSDSCP